MKRLVTPGLLLVLILSVVVTVPQEQAHGQSAGLVSSVLAKMQRNHETLKTLRARIKMQKYDAHLRENEEYVGFVLYKPGVGKNASFRLEWSSPAHEILGVDKGQYTLYRPKLGQVLKGSTGAKGPGHDSEILNMLSMSSTDLQNRFQPFQDVREESVDGVSATHLKLIPIKATSFSYAEVWVDSTGMPIKTKMVERNGDATTVTLSNLDKKRLSQGDFAVPYPANAKVIKG